VDTAGEPAVGIQSAGGRREASKSALKRTAGGSARRKVGRKKNFAKKLTFTFEWEKGARPGDLKR